MPRSQARGHHRGRTQAQMLPCRRARERFRKEEAFPGSGPPTCAQIAGRRAFSPNPSMTQRCVIRRRDLWSAGTQPVATFLGRSHPGSGQILASGRLARHASTGAPSRCCLPVRQGDCFPAVCAQTCGSLVRNGPEPVHMQWKCWGFRCLCRNLIGT